MTAGRALALGLWWSTAWVTGCAHPAPHPTTLRAVAVELERHFDVVFPGAEAIGLLRPRFGVPAILEGKTSFPLVVIERRQPTPRSLRAVLVRVDLPESETGRCLEGESTSDDCVPLDLEESAPMPLDQGSTLRTLAARPSTLLSARAYDLVIRAGSQRLRQRRVVFAREPSHERALSVVQLSDLHLGRPGEEALVRTRLAMVIRAVNELHPDVVVVTGDMAEQGRDAALEDAAATALREIEAPVLAVLGNHDYGHFPKVRDPKVTDAGYYNFARAFHGLRLFRTLVGGWDFVGFDSGPSLFSVRILTRGIDGETLRHLDEATEEDRVAGRGTVLFSHAPTRSALSSAPHALGSNRLGSMSAGAHELEQRFLAAERGGARIVHLSGHTHWSDVFTTTRDGLGFTRVPFEQLACPNTFDAASLMVNAPSATRITFPTLPHGRDFGFVKLLLGAKARTVQLQLYDAAGEILPCGVVRPSTP